MNAGRLSETKAGLTNPRKVGWSEIQWPLLSGLWLAGLVLGYIGFSQHAAALGENASPLDLFYLTLQLISLNSGAVSHPIPWELEIARLLLPIVAAYTAVKALASIFRQQIDLLRLNFFRNHILICGLSRKGFLLVEGFRQRGEPVVVIEHDEHNDWLEACRSMGAVVLLGDATDVTMLRKARLNKARCVIAVCNDDGINAEVAVRARALSAGREKHPLRCILHLVDPQLCDLLRERESEMEKDATLQLELFNVFDRGADILIQEHPLVPKDGAAPHVLIVGLGHMGESLLIHAAREWHSQHPANGRLRFTIVDQEARPITEALKTRYPQIATACELTPYQMNVRSPEFQRGDFLAIADNPGDIDIAYVCLDDDALGLHAGLILLQLLRGQKTSIVVRMAEKGGLATLLQGKDEGVSYFESLSAFALLDRTCTPEILLK